jgi:REP element-mobilizing transposase RayT
MPLGGYKIRNKEGIHFITFAVVEWVDVFTRREYRDIVLESLRYCQEKKGLLVHCWCIMTNHVHLVLSAQNSDTSDILRDFKKFTSKKILKAIEGNQLESRKEWMLGIFGMVGGENSRNGEYQFWRQENQPKELITPKFTAEKLNYIHRNPVEAGIVEKEEAYLYSSARDYHEGRNVGLLQIEFLE